MLPAWPATKGVLTKHVVLTVAVHAPGLGGVWGTEPVASSNSVSFHFSYVDLKNYKVAALPVLVGICCGLD